MKNAIFIILVMASSYSLIWYRIFDATASSTLFSLSIVTAAIATWAALGGGIILAFWMLPSASGKSELRSHAAPFLGCLPAALFIAQPVVTLHLSLIYLFGFPVLFLLFVSVFKQEGNLLSYSDSKIDITLHEIGFQTIDQPIFTRVIVFTLFVTLVALIHFVLIRSVS